MIKGITIIGRFSAALSGAMLIVALASPVGADELGKGYTSPLHNVSLRYDIVAPKKLDLKYDIYAGGFHALDASLELDLNRRAYDIGVAAKTEGFIGSMFPWQATYSTSGHADSKGVLIPTTAVSHSAWGHKVNVTEMTYDPKGTLVKTTEQEGARTTIKRDFDPKMANDAVDMLTGALLMMQNTRHTQKCEGSFPVFDGKRRFNITLHDDGTEAIAKSKYSSFEGQALRCTLKVEPVAGFKPKDMKRGWLAVQAHTEAHRKAPTIWLARLDKQGPVVPVRMEIASEYGAVVAHLSSTKAN
jgi:hypothetical protein